MEAVAAARTWCPTGVRRTMEAVAAAAARAWCPTGVRRTMEAVAAAAAGLAAGLAAKAARLRQTALECDDALMHNRGLLEAGDEPPMPLAVKTPGERHPDPAACHLCRPRAHEGSRRDPRPSLHQRLRLWRPKPLAPSRQMCSGTTPRHPCPQPIKTPREPTSRCHVSWRSPRRPRSTQQETSSGEHTPCLRTTAGLPLEAMALSLGRA